MKAMVTTKYGPIDVLEIQEREKPTPKRNEVLIKIHYTTVTIGDVKMRGLLDLSAGTKIAARMFLGWSKPKKDILGMEAAGEVEAVGSEVTKFKIGDRVFASTFWDGLGGYAQYKCIPEDSIIATIPETMSYEQAVPVLGGGLTAAKILKKANIQPGQKVLIYGASSSVGSYGVQLAKHFGTEVTAVCSASNHEWVKELGADKLIDYRTEDFTKSGETYDAIFDAVGKLSLSSSMKALEAGGVFLDSVHMLRRSVQAKFAPKKINKRILGGTATGLVEDLVYFRELIEAGKLKPVIDRIYPLEEIAEATRYVETGRKKGNVAITVVDKN